MTDPRQPCTVDSGCNPALDYYSLDASFSWEASFADEVQSTPCRHISCQLLVKLE